MPPSCSCFGFRSDAVSEHKQANVPKEPEIEAPKPTSREGRPSSADSQLSTNTIHPVIMVTLPDVRTSALFEPGHAHGSMTSPRHRDSQQSRPGSGQHSRPQSRPPSAVQTGFQSGAAGHTVSHVANTDPPKTMWTLPQGPFQRLNVVDGAPVNVEYIDGLTPLEGGGEVDSRLLECKDRMWRRLFGVKLSLCEVTQYVGLVRHHLRGGDVHSHHHEIWRMFLVNAPHNEGSWLWPVGRESDFADMKTLDLSMIRYSIYKEGVAWLDLSFTNITELPAEIGSMVSLTKLELNGNRLTSIPDSIASLTNLDLLSLHSNSITTITTRLCELTRLRWLSMNANELSSVPNVPPSVERMSMHMNAIDHVDEDGPLSRCHKLTVLSLFTNKVPRLPPSTMAVWLHMNKLSLQRNQLTEIPEEIGNLTELDDLWLYGNKLTQLPTSLGKLKKLRKLWANNNQLTSVPESLSDCPDLQDLYLGNNQLTSLPAEALVNGCKLLEKLQLGGNPQLDTSTLPQELQQILV